MTHKLSQVASGEVRRLIITLPPRTLKSLCASVALPAWFLGRNPSERVIVVSYSDILARSHANDFRLLVNDPIYQAAFPAMRLARDTDREIMTTKRGKRIATSIDGTLTGLGGNLIVIDDPIKLGDAMSEAVRPRVIEWSAPLCFRAATTRQRRASFWSCSGCTRTIWQATCRSKVASRCELPAIAQRNETYSLGDGRTYDRQKGELLHPEQEPAHVLAELKREMGPIAFSAQYQQSPIPPGGTIIKRKWLTPYDNVDHQPGDRIILSWDIALSEAETGDYSACVVLLQRGEAFYSLEVVRGRFPFNVLKRKVMEVNGATIRPRC